jgi:hypothetical protein
MLGPAFSDPIPVADITIDGNDGDWVDIDPQMEDAQGDTQAPEYQGTDIASVSVATNQNKDILYFLVRLVGSPNNDSKEGDNPEWGLVQYLVAFDDLSINSWGTWQYDWQTGIDNNRFWLWDLREDKDYPSDTTTENTPNYDLWIPQSNAGAQFDFSFTVTGRSSA